MKDKKSLKRIVSNNIFLFKYIWRFVPQYLICEIVYGILIGVISSMFTIYTKLFFDAISKDYGIKYILILTAVVFSINVCSYFAISYYKKVMCESMKQKLKLKMNAEIFSAVRRVDLACYDDPEFYNDFIWAMNNGETNALAMVDSIVNLLSVTTSIITTATIIATISLQLFAIAVAAVILTAFLERKSIRLSVKRNVTMNPLYRKLSYCERVFSQPDYAKEVRITHISDVMMDEYDKASTDIRDESRRFNLRALAYGLPRDLLGYLLEPGIYAVLLFQIMVTKTADIGGLAVADSTFWSFKYSLNDFFDAFLNFEKHALFTEKVRTLIEYEPKVKSGSIKAAGFETLEFRNVSFGYSDGNSVLNNVSFKIDRGEKIALVGYNGAGKSTVIKLMMRFYDPTDGEILLNGRNIREYDVGSYRDTIGTVFQDFRLFALTLAENVICDDVTDEDKPAVSEALGRSGFGDKLKELPNGLDTELTREFYDDGTDLSGGEAQKVAIARVFVRPKELILLDEPSSALDPLAEYELNQHISEHSVGKTVIFISHRLSTTRRVDRILMFDEGKIIESGSHSELMKQNGKYAQMFRLQAEKYSVATTGT